MINNSEFIKIGENIVAKPKGADYNLISGKTYSLDYDRYADRPIFKENGELNLPKKIYQTEKDKSFNKRIFAYFNKNVSNTTGVMLAGTKGTGKSIQAKIIAKESNLPIIIVASTYPAHKLTKFFKEFTTPVCVIFDEVEKNYDTERMLEFLDGIEKTTQKLILMTCNSLNRVSEYMQDRCSRIRYLRKYSAEDNIAFLPALIKDLGIAETRIEEIIDFCKNKIQLLSMDNMVAFLNEIKLLEDEDISLQEIIEYMNISTKNISGKINEEFDAVVEVKEEEDYRDDICDDMYDEEDDD